MEIRSDRIMVANNVPETGLGLVGTEIHDSLRKLTFPLHLVDGSVKIIEMTPGEFAELDVQDRILLGVALTESVHQPDEDQHKAWLYRLVNKEIEEGSKASSVQIENDANVMRRKGLIRRNDGRLCLAQAGASLLIDKFLFSFEDNESSSTKPDVYETFVFDDSRESRLFEFIADSITRIHPDDPTGRYLPLDNMTNVALTLAKDIVDERISAAKDKGRPESMWRLLKSLEQKYGVVAIDRLKINKKSSIPINVSITKKGHEAYENHVDRQLSISYEEEESEERSLAA